MGGWVGGWSGPEGGLDRRLDLGIHGDDRSPALVVEV